MMLLLGMFLLGIVIGAVGLWIYYGGFGGWWKEIIMGFFELVETVDLKNFWKRLWR